MAEIMYNSDILRQEYLHMLISYTRKDGNELFQDGNYLELPLLQRGLLWGIGRLCQGHKAEMLEKLVTNDIVDYLSSPDHHVVGLAIWCLGFLGSNEAMTRVAEFLSHTEEICLVLNDSFKTITLAKLAENALKMNKVCGECAW